MHYRLFWEEITEESAKDGDFADYGVVSLNGEYVSMSDVCGDEAKEVLEKNTFVFDFHERHDVFMALDDIIDELGGVDHFERFMNEFMIYGLNEALDEKVIRSAWVECAKCADVIEDFLNEYWS